jgi:hypothetical protein
MRLVFHGCKHDTSRAKSLIEEVRRIRFIYGKSLSRVQESSGVLTGASRRF